jgi:hypothetical protein
MRGGDHLEGPAPAVARRTSHVLVPCRSGAATFVRQLLARDLAGWEVDEGIADGLLLAAYEAVLDAVAARGSRPEHPGMLVIAWTLTPDRQDGQGRFRFSVVGRGSAAVEPQQHASTIERRRVAAMRAHPSAMGAHPALSQRRCAMDAVMDSVVVSNGSAGTRIVLEKSFPRPARA